MENDSKDILHKLSNIKNEYSLSILTLAEPILASASRAPTNGSRTSDISSDAYDNPSPESLEADLSHYKELFSKLRFSYLEQVTKEKFLRAIVGDPPLIVENQGNVELEANLAGVKAQLKCQKAEVLRIVEELESNELIQLQTTQLQNLPMSIRNLQESISALQASQIDSPNPSLALPLPATLFLLSEREEELALLEQQISTLQSTVPRKTRELERMESELKGLEMQKIASTTAAKEAQRRKEEGMGGIEDDLEERGRWYRAVSSGLKGMLDVGEP
ncbi:MAG: hypothetical protein M1829_005534 [Trizodia sp. TS-e1964]|nr:MAG: hypothetical protein M1829_005534 [Trizodia sp. TS-e1964]